MVAPLIAGLGLLGVLGGGQFAIEKFKDFQADEERDRQRSIFDNAGLLDPLTGQAPSPGLIDLFAEQPELVKNYTPFANFGAQRQTASDVRAETQLGLNVDAGTRAEGTAALAEDRFDLDVRKQDFAESQAAVSAQVGQQATQLRSEIRNNPEQAGQIAKQQPFEFAQQAAIAYGPAEKGFMWGHDGQIAKQAPVPGTKLHTDVVERGNNFGRIANSINEIDAAFNREGTELTGETAGLFRGQQLELVFLMKDLHTAGALDQGLIDIMEKMVPDFSSKSSFVATDIAVGSWSAFKRNMASRQNTFTSQTGHIPGLQEANAIQFVDIIPPGLTRGTAAERALSEELAASEFVDERTPAPQGTRGTGSSQVVDLSAVTSPQGRGRF